MWIDHKFCLILALASSPFDSESLWKIILPSQMPLRSGKYVSDSKGIDFQSHRQKYRDTERIRISKTKIEPLRYFNIPREEFEGSNQ